MKKINPLLCSFLSSAGVVVYVALVGFIIMNGEKIFGKISGILGIMLMLLLLVLSAGVTGTLVFGGPVWLYLQKKKTEAIKMLFTNFIFLAITVFAMMLLLFLV